MGNHFTMPTQLSTVNQMAAWARIDAEQLIETEAARLKSIVENVMNVCTEYDAARQAATTNSHLTSTGQQSAIRSAAEKGAETIRGYTDKFLADLATRAGTLSSALASSVNGDMDVLTLMKVQERRALLASMDELSVQIIYTTACETGDDELTCLAVETAPSFAKLVTPAVKELGMATRAAHNHPDKAEQLRQVRVQHEIVALSRNAALRELAQMPDTLAEQAKGQSAIKVDDNDQIDD